MQPRTAWTRSFCETTVSRNIPYIIMPPAHRQACARAILETCSVRAAILGSTNSRHSHHPHHSTLHLRSLHASAQEVGHRKPAKRCSVDLNQRSGSNRILQLVDDASFCGLLNPCVASKGLQDTRQPSRSTKLQIISTPRLLSHPSIPIT